MGHHSHVQHGAERYKPGVILYSFGNFVFDQPVAVRRVSRLYRIKAGTDSIRNVLVLPLSRSVLRLGTLFQSPAAMSD